MVNSRLTQRTSTFRKTNALPFTATVLSALIWRASGWSWVLIALGRFGNRPSSASRPPCIDADPYKPRRSVVSGKALSDQNFGSIYLKLGLGRCVTSEPNDAKLNPDKLPKHMATTVEAIIAAAFLDGGDEALELVMGRFGMDQHFHEEPALYDFFRHGQPSEVLSSPSTPSPGSKAEKAGKATSSV